MKCILSLVGLLIVANFASASEYSTCMSDHLKSGFAELDCARIGQAFAGVYSGARRGCAKLLADEVIQHSKDFKETMAKLDALKKTDIPEFERQGNEKIKSCGKNGEFHSTPDGSGGTVTTY